MLRTMFVTTAVAAALVAAGSGAIPPRLDQDQHDVLQRP
jgi:hypothetical protein